MDNEKYIIDDLNIPNIFELREFKLYSVNNNNYLEDDSVADMINHVDRSMLNATKSLSKLTDIMTLHSVVKDDTIPRENKLIGFSGYSFRHLMNNLCNRQGANYLEVGVFRGSTLISAVYGNENTMGEVHAVDNYSEFNSDLDPKTEYESALDKFLPDTKDKINFHEADCFTLDLKVFPKIDIYFYDGEHSEESQYRAFKYYEPVFSDLFIAVVDDWEQKNVREGTRRAFKEIDYDIVSSRAIIPPSRIDSDGNILNRVNHPTLSWWCGTHVFVLKKRA